MRIACSKYTDLDEKVIEKATSLYLPIIGGTALEIWANHYNHPGVRKRSDNDLDFISYDKKPISEFKKWLRENVDSTKVQVDVMFIQSHDFYPYITKVDGVLTMSLPYLLWSKLTRGLKRDLEDIKWILSITQVPDKEFEDALNDLGVTDKELDILYELAKES